MKRDNFFDVAFQNVAHVRQQARQRKAAMATAVAIGACGLGSCDGAAAGQPECTDFSLGNLDRNYQVDSVSFINLAAGATVDVTMNPLDSFFCPLAVSMTVTDAVDPALTRRARVLQARIRGCTQFDWQNPADTLAGATNWIDSQQWNPEARAGCACPVNLGCYTNQGNRQALLSFTIANPHPVPITGLIMLWGVAYSCCPGFTNDKTFMQPRTPDPVPVRNTAPAGRAPVFGARS